MGPGVADRQNEAGDAQARALRLALAQLPVRMRRGLRLFRELTGLSAVTSLRTTVDGETTSEAITPAVHPRCASRLRRLKSDAPCEEQWRWHLQVGLRTSVAHSHVCPLDLRCSCVPIFYGKTLVGTAKVVVGPDTSDRRFALATQALEIVVSKVSSDLHVGVLEQELDDARQQVAELQSVRHRALSARRARNIDTRTRRRATPTAQARSLIDQTLAHLAKEYLDPSLSLLEVARAMGVNDKYLTRLFTRVVGQHMHGYLVTLRVHHASGLLIASDKPIKQVAFESGFRSADRFRRAFRDNVGMAPAAYRSTFTPA